MATITHLHNRNGTYYCRVKVPKTHQEQLGKKEIWKSLGKLSFSEASRKVKLEAYKIFCYIEGMKLDYKPIRELRNDDVPIFAEHAYSVTLAHDENKRSDVRKLLKTAIKMTGAEDDTYSEKNHYGEYCKKLSEDVTEGNWDRAVGLASSLIKDAELTVDEDKSSNRELNSCQHPSFIGCTPSRRGCHFPVHTQPHEHISLKTCAEP